MIPEQIRDNPEIRSRSIIQQNKTLLYRFSESPMIKKEMISHLNQKRELEAHQNPFPFHSNKKLNFEPSHVRDSNDSAQNHPCIGLILEKKESPQTSRLVN